MARILVIDDDAAVRRAVRRMLERAGHEVLEVGDGEAGIRLHRATPANLILTDIYMPGQDGLTTIRQLRQEWPEVKIVAVSGGSRAGPTDLSEQAKLLGANATLSKPFEMLDLIAVVRALLGEAPTPS